MKLPASDLRKAAELRGLGDTGQRIDHLHALQERRLTA